MALRLVVLRLPPVARFKTAGTNPVFHSSTLFAALLESHLHLGGEAPPGEFAEAVKVSSVFRGVEVAVDGESREVFFLPVVDVAPLLGELSEDESKRLKNVKEASLESLFSSPEEREVYECLRGGTKEPLFLLTRQELKLFERTGSPPRIWEANEVEPHNVIDRFTGESRDFFFEECTWYRRVKVRGSELRPFFFFFADVTVEGEGFLKKALNFLCDEGLGGSRFNVSSAFAGYDVRKHEWSVSEGGEWGYLLLSLYTPSSKEDFDDFLYYSIVRVGGFRAHRFRKKQVHFVGEGSFRRFAPDGESEVLKQEAGGKVYFVESRGIFAPVLLAATKGGGTQ